MAPTIPLLASKEISVRQALAGPHRALCEAAIHVELDKMLVKHKAFVPIEEKDIPLDAARIYSRMFIKEKFTGAGYHVKVGARLAAGGNRQPSDSYFDTFAPIVDETVDKLIVAAFYADAIKNGYTEDMTLCDFDVPGAFLNIPLDTTNCPRPIVMRLSADLPHPLAGPWVLLKKGVYGLKQLNNMFGKELRHQFTLVGFSSDPPGTVCFLQGGPC